MLKKLRRRYKELSRNNKPDFIQVASKFFLGLKVSLPTSPVNNSPTGEFYDEASQIEAQELVKWSQTLP